VVAVSSHGVEPAELTAMRFDGIARGKDARPKVRLHR
jgi:hypothetical protein